MTKKDYVKFAEINRSAMNDQVLRWEKLYNYERRHRKWALKKARMGFNKAWARLYIDWEKAEAEVKRLKELICYSMH